MNGFVASSRKVGLLLNIVYSIALVLASPWLIYRFLRFGKNRRGWAHKILGLVPRRNSDQACIWFHAVSVGEVNLLAPIVQRLQQQRPEIEIVVSTTTETGYDLAKQKFASSAIFFFPFDFTWACRSALRRVRPNLIVLAELEIWPNFIRIASTLNGPDSSRLCVINGRLSESSFRGYQRFRWLLNSSFQRLNIVAAQNQTYADRFIELGCAAENVVVTGGVKYDGIQTNRQNESTLRLARLANIRRDEFVFLAGSTQAEEDILAAKVYLQLVPRYPNLRLILAPRHPERCPQLIRSLTKLGLEVRLRSDIPIEFGEATTPRSDGSQRPLIIDVIGELGAWWGVADAAYVGGSLGSRGGQNMIEPAGYGIPVSFGPNTRNFKTVVDQLLDADAATVVHDESELSHFVEEAISNRQRATHMGQRAQAAMLSHVGAATRTVDLLLKFFDVD